jgi:histidinol phosphatase-like enzyme
MTELSELEVNGAELLRQKGVKRFAEVWTADDKPIGQAISLHHRTHDINPELKMYQSYLESNSVKMGGSVFIPTDFIANYDPVAAKITLSVNMRTVQREAWDRTPDFIAHRTSEVEELPV